MQEEETEKTDAFFPPRLLEISSSSHRGCFPASSRVLAWEGGEERRVKGTYEMSWLWSLDLVEECMSLMVLPQVTLEVSTVATASSATTLPTRRHRPTKIALVNILQCLLLPLVLLTESPKNKK